MMVRSIVDGCPAPSTRAVRAATYQMHRSHIAGEIKVRGKRFEKITVPGRMAKPNDKSSVGAGEVQIPSARSDHMYPHKDACLAGNGTRRPMLGEIAADKHGSPACIEACVFEGALRSAAADMSLAFFSAIPGVAALVMIQQEVAWAAEQLAETSLGAAFEASHLYPKGSIGLMPTKSGHDVSASGYIRRYPAYSPLLTAALLSVLNHVMKTFSSKSRVWKDRNGPAGATAWQNLGVCDSGAQLELVAVVHGHEVAVEASFAHMVLFAAWLPHLTRNARSGPAGKAGDWRMHHTSYVRFGTESFAMVAGACRRAGVAMEARRIIRNGL